MALGKGLGQNAYAASNVYKGGASDDIQDVASRMADPNDPLALRLMAEATVLDIVRSARDADGQRPLSAACLSVREAAARRAGYTAGPGGHPVVSPADRDGLASFMEAAVAECEARGWTLDGAPEVPSTAYEGGVMRLSPLDPALCEGEVSVCEAGVDPIYFVPALSRGAFGPRAMREGAATFDPDAAALAAAKGDEGRRESRTRSRRAGGQDPFFCLITPADECGLTTLARYCDHGTWADLTERVAGYRSVFGDYRGGTTGRRGRFAVFQRGGLASWARRVSKTLSEAIGGRPSEDALAACLGAGLSRSRQAAAVGAACLDELYGAGAEVAVDPALGGRAAGRGDFLRVEATCSFDGGASCHVRCLATGYGAPRSAPEAVRAVLDEADCAGDVVNIYDGTAAWRVVEDTGAGLNASGEVRTMAASPDVCPVDARNVARVFLGRPAEAADALGRPTGPGLFDGSGQRQARLSGTTRANSVSLRPGRSDRSRGLRLCVVPVDTVSDGMKVESPGRGQGWSVENVDAETARRELAWMADEAARSMADRVSPMSLAAAVAGGADPSAVPLDVDREVASFQRQLLDYLSGRSDGVDGVPVDGGLAPTAAARAAEAVRAAGDWARSMCGGEVDGALRVAPRRISAFCPSVDGAITCGHKVDCLMRQAALSVDQVFGAEGTFGRDLEAMVAFDGASATDSSELGDDRPMARAASAAALGALASLGLTDTACAVDGRGVMRYEGTLPGTPAARFTGYLGQVFDVDGRGVATTTFLGRENHEFVPSMAGRYVESGKATGKKEDRIEVRDPARRLADAVAREVASQVVGRTDGRASARKAGAACAPVHGETALNRVWRAMEEEKWEEGGLEAMGDHGHDVDALVRRYARSVRFPTALADAAGVDALFAAEDACKTIDGRRRWRADRMADGLDLTGRRCVRTAGHDHMFDALDLVYTSTKQGVVQVLGEGVSIASDGHPVPADQAEVFGPLTAKGCHSYTRANNPADRAGMTLSNNRVAIWADQTACVAQMCLGGLTMEDAYVVSAAWAAAHPVPDGRGGERPLMAGDKLCDKSGNKGVISFVADPAADIGRLGYAQAAAVRLFAANPHLDMVASGWSNLSRLNGGTLAEMMDHPADLVIPEAPVVMGRAELPEAVSLVGPDGAFVTERGARVLDEEDARAKVEALFDGSDHVVELGFGPSADGALSVVVGASVTGARRQYARECLVSAMGAAHAARLERDPSSGKAQRRRHHSARKGLESSALKAASEAAASGAPICPQEQPARLVRGGCGTIHVDVTDKLVDVKTHVYDADAGEGRNTSGQLLWILSQEGCDGITSELYGRESSFSHIRERCRSFGVTLADDGAIGRMEAPEDAGDRAIELPVGQVLAGAARQAGSRGAACLGASRVPRLDMALLRSDVARCLRGPGGYVEVPFEVSFGPDSHGVDQPVPYDAERGVWRLPVMAVSARRASVGPDGMERESDVTRMYAQTLTAVVAQDFYRRCAAAFEAAGDAARAAECAERADRAEDRARGTVLRLSSQVEREVCDTKANEFVKRLLKGRIPGSSTAVWHPDPSLSVTEVALSPEIAENAGVADGDWVLTWRDPILKRGGVRYLRARVDEAIADIAVNPVTAMSYDGDFDGDTIGVVPLRTPEARAEAAARFTVAAPGVRLDVSAPADDRGNKPVYFNEGGDVARGIAERPGLSEGFAEGRVLANEGAPYFVSSYDAHVSEALAASTYRGHILVSSPEACATSLYRECVETGVKGSVGKIEDLFSYAGFDLSMADDGSIVSIGGGGCGRTAERTAASQISTAVKSEGTGKSGAWSKRFVAACRGGDVEAATELIYLNTQSLLQAKHDAVRAMGLYRLMGKPARTVYSGGLIEPDGDGWSRTEPGQADPDRWAENVNMFVTDPRGMGLSVDPDLAKRLASQLTVRNEDGVEEVADVTRRSYVDHLGSSTLDYLAYSFGPHTMREVADAGGANLYDGLEAVAPPSVKEARRAQGRGDWGPADARALFAESHYRPVAPVHGSFLSTSMGRQRDRDASGPSL